VAPIKHVNAQDESIHKWDGISNPHTRLLSGSAGLLLLLLGRHLSSISPHQWINLTITILGSLLIIMAFMPSNSSSFLGSIWQIVSKIGRWLNVSDRRILIILLGLGLSLSSSALAGDNPLAIVPYYWIFWVSGIGLVFAGCWQEGTTPLYRRIGRKEWYLLCFILASAFIFRSVNLSQIPYGLSGDEGSAGLTGLEFISGERNNILGMGWYAFPAPYFWFVSIAQRLLGPSIEAIRIISSIGGTLVIGGVYFATRALFSRSHALIAAIFLSTFHFHILFSRVAVNNVWDGLFLALMIGAIWVAWNENHRSAFIVGGLAIGLSQYFYPTAHLLPIYAIIWLIVLRIFNPKQERLPGLVCLTLVAIAVVLPLILYYGRNPEHLIAPMQRVSILNLDWIKATVESTGKNPFILYAEQFWTTIKGFTEQPVRGLYSPQTPMCLTFSATLLFAGVVISLLRIKDPRYSVLLLGLLGPVIAGTFSAEAPNTQRLLYATTPIAILISISLIEFRDLLIRAWPSRHRLFTTLPFIIITGIGLYNLSFFSNAMREQRFSDSAAFLARQITDYLIDKPDGTKVYFMRPSRIGYHSLPCISYLTPNVEGDDLYWPLEPYKELPQDQEELILIFQPETIYSLPEIQRHFPQSKVNEIFWEDNILVFVALEIGL